MSLTSYRAAPPRDKPLLAFCREAAAESRLAIAALIDPLSFLRRRSRRDLPEGCERYVSTRNWFGKGSGRSFFDFVTG